MKGYDPREAQLARELENARARLTDRVEALEASLRRAADPFDAVRKNPVVGIAAAVAGGLLLGALMPSLGSARRGSAGAVPEPSPLLNIVAQLLPAVVPLFVSFVGKSRER